MLTTEMNFASKFSVKNYVNIYRENFWCKHIIRKIGIITKIYNIKLFILQEVILIIVPCHFSKIVQIVIDDTL